MNDFSDCLRKLSARLPIPEPARSRVLLEMATDMDDLLRHHLDIGTGREEAVRIVEEQFELSDEALAELVQLHNSPLQRSLDGLSKQAGSSWERVVLALIALFVIPGLVTLLLQPGLFGDASPLAWALVSNDVIESLGGIKLRDGPVEDLAARIAEIIPYDRQLINENTASWIDRGLLTYDVRDGHLIWRWS